MKRVLPHASNHLPPSAIPFVAAIVLAGVSAAQTGSTQRVSLGSMGVQGDGDSHSGRCSMDGRFVAFESSASNFAAGDTNSGTDVFVHDRVIGITTLMSRSIHGVPGHGYSFGASISADGRYVAFSSTADDLVPTDSNGSALDVFVHDRVTGVIELVSVSSTGTHGDYDSGWGSAISADGRFVAFASNATNLVPGGTDGSNQVFIHERATGITKLVSVSNDGSQANDSCIGVAVSGDGRFVTFDTGATNLVPGDTNASFDVFVRDVLAEHTECVTVDASGVPGNDWSYAGYLSADGRYVTFASYSSNLVPGDANGQCDAFVRDRATGVTQLVSVDSSGNQSNGYSFPPSISADGRYFAFDSTATNLDPNYPLVSPWDYAFFHDRVTGETKFVGLTSSGTVWLGGSVYAEQISPDGRSVLFSSYGNEVPGDSNGKLDLFVRELQGCSATIASYCSAGTTTSGCVPSISGSGTPSASAGSGFTIAVDSVEGHKNGMFLYGLSGPQSSPWGASFLCVQPPLQRMGLMPSGGTIGSCDGQLSIDWNQYIATHHAALGSPFQSGEIVWIQALFRDPAAPGGSNLSNSLWFSVCP
jgi:Tol biopolymer transport system component